MIRNIIKVSPRATAPLAFRLYSSKIPLTVPIELPNLGGKRIEQPTGLFINNQFVRSAQGKTFEVINPSTEEELAQVYESREEDVDTAVDYATAAFESWSTTDPAFRAGCLYRLADKIEEHAEELAGLESLDNGKALVSARGDIQLVVAYIRSTAGIADKIMGTVPETGETHFSFTRREPIGVCGQIIPWNFPLLMWSWKIAPALAAGNTVVMKTAESTPLSALYASKFIEECGFPAGVYNILSGFGKITGNALAMHPKIKKIAFTGSTATGKHIMKCAAESNLKKVTLELGGKSPNLIFADADMDATVRNIVLGIYYNAGEVCSAGSRVYVEDSVYDQVLEKLKVASNELIVGDPFGEGVFQGAQTSKNQLDKILGYVEIGRSEGATLVAGGERIGDKGFFIRPTIFGDVTEDMRIVREEIFGPVVVVSRFSDVDDAVRLANNTSYGLAAGIHTTNVNTAINVARKIKAGTVWINTYNDFHAMVPFGGFGQSGIGREMGIEAIDNYTQVKAVRMKLQQ